MRRSRTKRRSRLFLSGVILLVLLVALISVNIALGFLKDTLRTITAAYFTQRVIVENILYLPPNYIFLKNVSLIETGTQPEKQILTIPLVMVKFSLLRFARSGRIAVTDICAYAVNSRYADFRDFVRENAKQIVVFLLDLPRQDARFMVRNLRLELAPEDGGPGAVDSKLFVKIKKEAMYGYGSITRNLQGQAAPLPVDYVFSGYLTKDGISLESLEVMRENFYAKLWGSLRGGVVRTKGFVFINTFFEEHDYTEPYLTFQERTENFLRGFPAPPKTGVMPKVDLFILDIESQADFREFPRVDIHGLKFSLNNNPVALTGSMVVSWKDPIKLDLDFSTQFTRLKGSAQEDLNLKRLDVKLNGLLKDTVYTGDATAQFEFLKKVKSSTPIEAVSAKLSGLNLSFARYPRVTASVRLAELYCRTDTNEYSFLLPYLSAAADLADPKVKFAQFYSGFCDGSIAGRARLDLSKPQPQLSSTVRLKDVTTNKLDSVMVHFSKVHGKMSGLMQFRSYPEAMLKGGMIVKQGYAENFEFLKWLSESFSLPSLRRLEFPRATAYFTVDKQGAGLRDLYLSSTDLALSGAFRLGANNLVNSKLSLTLSKNLMQRSQKFKQLLRLVGKDVNVLTFDFKLSGNLNTMNFLWLESDFKRRLRDAIPGFMEKYVEKQIEESLAPLSRSAQ